MRDNVKGGALTEVTFFVLLALYEPRHGYAVMQFVEETTGGRLVLGAGTLYGAITTLCDRGWIEACGNDRRQKKYRITGEGRAVTEKERQRLRELLKTADAIIGGILE